MSLFRYKAVVAYDGTNYHGYQSQVNQRTVQSELEKAIKKMFVLSIKTVAASRTDQGVHALGQVIHFDLPFLIKNQRIKEGLNRILPSDIRIMSIKKTHPDFHARFDAKSKVYYYKIYKKEPAIFNRLDGVYIKGLKINEEAHQIFKQLEGTHDFSAFSPNHDQKPPIKTIYQVSIKETRSYYLLVIHGNHFLKYMVRSMVGNFIAICLGQKPSNHLTTLLTTKDRLLSAKTIKPNGLTLFKIYY